MKLEGIFRAGTTWFNGGRRISRRVAGMLTVLSLLVLASTAYAAPAVSAGTDPTDGYPFWYQDNSAPGIRVEPCLDPADPFCVLIADPPRVRPCESAGVPDELPR